MAMLNNQRVGIDFIDPSNPSDFWVSFPRGLPGRPRRSQSSGWGSPVAGPFGATKKVHSSHVYIYIPVYISYIIYHNIHHISSYIIIYIIFHISYAYMIINMMIHYPWWNMQKAKHVARLPGRWPGEYHGRGGSGGLAPWKSRFFPILVGESMD